MTEQTVSKVPQIRFKGFAGKWEEKALGDLFSITSAARVHKNEWSKSGVPFFRSSDVVSYFKGNENTQAFISHELYEELSSKVGRIKKGDMLVTGGGSIGIPYLVKTDAPLYFKDADLLWFKIREAVDSHYLYTFFSSELFRRYLRNISHIGTIAHYTVEQAKSTPLRLPKNAPEQTQIGGYFRELDQLICLHQRKHDKLVTLKKAMLQKMFPEPGANTPEIRFKGFSEPWKENELGELVTFFKGKGLSKSEIDPSGTAPCIHYGQLFTEYSEVISNVISRAQGGNNYFRSIANDVLMPTSDVTPRGLAKASAINESDVIIGGDILVIRGDKKLLLGSFLSRFIRFMESQVLQMVSGSTVFHLYSSSMEKFRVKYPSVSEQQKIGTYFRTLDSLISKHAIQLQKLKQIKSACLEKMFV